MLVTPEAIRVGDWKLYTKRVKGVPGSERGPALFNLADDPAEETNVSADHSERVAEMKALAEKRLAEIEANSIPMGGPPAGKRK